MAASYVYIIATRECLNLGIPVYKIGKSRQENHKRFKQYPKGSRLLFQIACCNCDQVETLMISKFKSSFKHRPDYGAEYFEGDPMDMIDLCIVCVKFIHADDPSKPLCDVPKPNTRSTSGATPGSTSTARSTSDTKSSKSSSGSCSFASSTLTGDHKDEDDESEGDDGSDDDQVGATGTDAKDTKESDRAMRMEQIKVFVAAVKESMKDTVKAEQISQYMYKGCMAVLGKIKTSDKNKPIYVNGKDLYKCYVNFAKKVKYDEMSYVMFNRTTKKILPQENPGCIVYNVQILTI